MCGMNIILVSTIDNMGQIGDSGSGGIRDSSHRIVYLLLPVCRITYPCFTLAPLPVTSCTRTS